MRRLLTVGVLAALPVLAGLLLPGLASARPAGGLAPDLPGHGRVPHVARATSPSENLGYNGGPVLRANRTHVIFWQPSGSGLSFEAGYVELVQRFLGGVAADSHRATNPYGLTGQYTDSSGPAVYDSSFGGSVLDQDPLPANGCLEPPVTGPGWTVCLSDQQLAEEIQQVVQSRHLPTTPRDVYFLVTPKGLGSCMDASSTSCALGGEVTGYCAYHGTTAGGSVLYAVIAYNAVPGHCQSDNPRPNHNPADPTLSSLSHEHNELITDPYDDAWLDSSGNENGDKCISSFGPAVGGSGSAAYNEVIHGGHYYLQEEWSNADRGCEARAAPDSASFVVGRPGGGRRFTLTGSAAAPKRQVVAYRWFFGDGRSGSGRQVSHGFARPGTYRVTLRAVDSWGDWALYARTIRVSGTARERHRA